MCVCVYIEAGDQDEVDKLGTGDMIAKELQWLASIQIPSAPSYGFQTLLAGHLRLCTVLFTFERVENGE